MPSHHTAPSIVPVLAGFIIALGTAPAVVAAPTITLTVTGSSTVLPSSDVTLQINRANTEQGLGGLAYTISLDTMLEVVGREYSDFGWVAADGLFDNSNPVDDNNASGVFQTMRFDTIPAGAAGAEFPANTAGTVEQITLRMPAPGLIPPNGLMIGLDLINVSASNGAGADWTLGLGGSIVVATDTNGHAFTLTVVALQDCNSNGVFDGDDLVGGTSNDCNSNGQPDECEPDCNNNQTPDDCDITAGTSQDCNTNGQADQCEIAAINNCCDFNHGSGCNDPAVQACVCAADAYCCDTQWDRLCTTQVESLGCGTCVMASDCNNDGIPDDCQPDLDGDGIPDDCDTDIDGDGVPNTSDPCLTQPGEAFNPAGGPLGDFDDDCMVTLLDYPWFETCLTFGGPGVNPPGSFCEDRFDFEPDGDVDAADFAAFQADFVALP